MKQECHYMGSTQKLEAYLLKSQNPSTITNPNTSLFLKKTKNIFTIPCPDLLHVIYRCHLKKLIN